MNPSHPQRPLPLKTLVGLNERLKVVDIGASPMDGQDPPYLNLLRAGDIDLVGFEAHGPSLAELNSKKGPHETYLPLAVGDGRRHTLNICRATGLSSVLEPSQPYMKLFHFFPVWARVLEQLEVDTVRLDDVPETTNVDYIKIDIQGGELMAFKGGAGRLKDVSVIDTEVSFLPMYVGQPLFSEVEQFLRAQGFMFHRFNPVVSRYLAPFLLNNEIYGGMSQVMQADAVFVRDFTRLDLFTVRQLVVTATILHDCYQSFDAVLYLLTELGRRQQSDVANAYVAALQPYFPGQTVWAWHGPVKAPPANA